MNFQELFNQTEFVQRHIGYTEAEEKAMLAAVGEQSMADFVKNTVPSSVLMDGALALPKSMSEANALAKIKAIADQNIINKSYIGMGYSPTILPNVLLRNVLENPGWYTAYTPYQAEVSQGRLEALINFQQVCIDLSGLPLAGASLLDEATAAAEAMAMAKRVSKSKSNRFFVDERAYPQTIDVIKTRAEFFGFELVIGNFTQVEEGEYFGAFLQYIATDGSICDLSEIIAKLQSKQAIVAVAADIMSLVLLKSPGEMGADIALGSTQRFGLPMAFGGPHAAYFAFKDSMKRSAPGRIIGVSIDANGKQVLRMALQTREQHIRREKANSNICTSQVLLANLAGLYAVYHGPKGVRRIAKRIHALATAFANAVSGSLNVLSNTFFDTVQVDCGKRADTIFQAASAKGYNLWRVSENILSVSFHEQSSAQDFADLTYFFLGEAAILPAEIDSSLSERLLRKEAILTHPVFNLYHTEHEMLRYLKRLENKDLALNHSMISLGSCTMKLNAVAEMLPITWPQFTEIHPFAPKEQTQGYLNMIEGLKDQLKAITGFEGMCMQPNSGASGEYAGLLTIRRYHNAQGQTERNVCLIPRSAHGTNPATAHMLGMKIVIVATDEQGNVDMDDMRTKVQEHREKLGALMITYPSTHGVYEEGIRDICQMIHEAGGQVYMDGANMNAQVAVMQPADIGADVLHMNLHKTFAIPHGGGGPGVGPIGMKKHLMPFAPSHTIMPPADTTKGVGAVSAAPFGSAGVMPITWMYITLMGSDGLRKATEGALLNANYIATELAKDYPILYAGKNGRVAHECIVDLRPLKASSGITEVDVAKRLMDFGFHAPTMSFPVPGTLMIEPTESESKAELDRFIAAMCQIKVEILKVQNGEWTLEDNPLVNAPHTALDIAGDWARAYSREEAVYPLPYLRHNKYWPAINRADDVYGDRNLVCACPPMENYES